MNEPACGMRGFRVCSAVVDFPRRSFRDSYRRLTCEKLDVPVPGQITSGQALRSVRVPFRISGRFPVPSAVCPDAWGMCKEPSPQRYAALRRARHEHSVERPMSDSLSLVLAVMPHRRYRVAPRSRRNTSRIHNFPKIPGKNFSSLATQTRAKFSARSGTWHVGGIAGQIPRTT